jgi:hypothetical protein
VSYAFLFELDGFGALSPEGRLAVEYAALEALCTANVAWLETHPETPALYSAPVRYVEDKPGREFWRDIPGCLRARQADCPDLACWRVAELRRQGIDAHPYVTLRELPGMTLFHVQVRTPGGLEDPSKVLGMR